MSASNGTKFLRKSLILLIVMVLSTSGYSSSWHCWGGNYARTNCSADTSVDPSKDDFDLIWRAQIKDTAKEAILEWGKPGGGPVINDGVVYVRESVFHVHALNLFTGEPIWKSPMLVDRPADHTYGASNNSLCYGDGYLVYQTYRTLGCLMASTGELVWKFEKIGRQSHKQYSPAIYQGVVYGCYVDDARTKTVYFARNVADGSVVWEYILDGYAWGGTAVSPPAPAIDTANKILYGSTCKKLSGEMSYPLYGKTFALNLQTGALIWENNDYYSDYRNYGHLAVYRDNLYLTTLNYGCDKPDSSGDSVTYSRCDMYSIMDATTGKFVCKPVEVGGSGARSVALYDTVLITGKYYNERFDITNLLGTLVLGSTSKAASPLMPQGQTGCGTPIVVNGYVFRANGTANTNTDLGEKYMGQITASRISDVLTKDSRDTLISWAYATAGSCIHPVVGNGVVVHLGKNGVLSAFANVNKLPVLSETVTYSKAAGVTSLTANPNPFNPVTEISFVAARGVNTSVKVYNSKGEYITTLLSGAAIGGKQKVMWNASKMTSGVYVVRMKQGNKTSTLKVVYNK